MNSTIRTPTTPPKGTPSASARVRAVKPILFCTEMRRAIRSGAKVQTRRIMDPQPTQEIRPYQSLSEGGEILWGHDLPYTGPDRGEVKYSDGSTRPLAGQQCKTWRPPYPVGTVLYVKEPTIQRRGVPRELLGYFDDGARVLGDDETRVNAIFMPRKFARDWLEVVAARPERVTEISEEDAIAEGVGYGFQMNGGWPDYQHINASGVCTLTQDSAAMSFASLWDSLHAKHGRGWEDDWPGWVWVYGFRRVGAPCPDE